MNNPRSNLKCMTYHSFLILMSLWLVVACAEKEKPFIVHHGQELGINFQNSIATTDSLNALSFEYIYNGSGVGIGDFNADGLPDIFFGGNQVSSRLYLNKGDLHFEDGTTKAGVSTTAWVTGVSVADVNQDGWPDVYLSVAGQVSSHKRKNLLFMHQGLRDGAPVFKESAAAYGLDSDDYSTMAAFLDYDKDGDLDMYLVNNWLESFNRNNLRPKRTNREAESTDRIYRNNGNQTFTDVSVEAGITIEGYGLGITVSDMNQDSWPDIYVSNDFMSNDLLWINQGNGTFKNEIAQYLKHQSHNGMGMDIADFNNDALPDVVVVDMLPPDHKRQKLMTPGQNYDHFNMALDLGYQPQYMRNTLQLNRGQMADGRILFSEIAFMAGVSATDWSWAPLFADFDNDGLKDLFIGNGYRKDVTDLDFIFFGLGSEGSPFGTPQARRQKFYQELENLPEVKLPNHLFKNAGHLQFKDVTTDWGIDLPTFTNGTAYADLDSDGDLDLVTNNIDQPVLVYENRHANQKPASKYLRLHQLDTVQQLNEKIYLYSQGQVQFVERTPFRGFQSSIEADVHFGLPANVVDSIVIVWLNQTQTVIKAPRVNSTIGYSYRNATPVVKHVQTSNTFFQAVHPAVYQHKETSAPDIKATRTLLHELTRTGPCVASADVDHNNLDDFAVGGDNGTPVMLFMQQENGHFIAKALASNVTAEAGALLFFDANQDGHTDLYVGYTASTAQAQAARHQILVNDGEGNFTVSTDVLPLITTSTTCVETTDFDNDGDQDLFVGGRFKAGQYPIADRSYWLQNETGKFIDVTPLSLTEPGLVADARWIDIDRDGRKDLITVGEWQPIRIYKNTSDGFEDVTTQYELNETLGWWNCLTVADLNQDGYDDVVLGNTGINAFFQPSPENPVELYAADFDKNGMVDPLISYFNPMEQERFFVHNRMVLIDQIPSIKKRIETFTQYATTPINKLFTKDELARAARFSANTLASVILVNQVGKAFHMKELPTIVQASSIRSLLATDFNGDGFQDLLLAGNQHEQETLYGRYDASIGTILLGDGKLNWKEWLPQQSGFVADQDVRSVKQIKTRTGTMLIVANNNHSMQFFVADK